MGWTHRSRFHATIGNSFLLRVCCISNTVYRDADGIHSLIGEVVTTFREFTFGSFQFALRNPKKLDRQVTLFYPLSALHLLSSTNNWYRPGYRSSGGFSIDEVVPLAFETIKPLATAYRLHCVATKLDRKDVMGKSGMK